MMKNIKSISVLVAICSVMCLLLACTNRLTYPIIEANKNAAANEALQEVMADGKGFEEVNLADYKLPATVTKAYKETSGLGYVLQLETSGYGSGLILMCGVATDGTITGATCIASSETNGAEENYGSNFVGKDLTGADAVDTIAGSTLTTAAYKNAMKDAINAATILGGGSADLRSEEEILADNLKEALPAGENTFVKLFFTEEIVGVDAIYAAENEAGYVCVIGDEFIGVDYANNSTSEVAVTAVKTLAASTLTEIDPVASGIHQNIKKAYKTATGNYVFEIDAAGYGIKGGDKYHPASGKYIQVKVSMTADGKIIDCLTVFQAESENVGDACAKENFYGQFDGKTADTLNEVDTITGATITTDGYKEAIQRCFDAVTILEGGAA